VLFVTSSTQYLSMSCGMEAAAAVTLWCWLSAKLY